MTGSAHGGPADDNDVGGVFRVCVGVEESARSAPLMWGVFDEPLTDHDLLVLSRAFDFFGRAQGALRAGRLGGP